MKRVYRILASLVIAAYFLISILTLQNYGINWDEVNHLTRGQAYLYYFLTGKQHYDPKLFDAGNRYSFYQIPQYDFVKQKKIDGDHPVLSDIASSFFNFIFYQKLGIINDFDAYHLYGPVIVTLFLLILFFWVERYYGGFPALISVLALITYPLFYGESHFNVQKDIPESVFYGLAIMTFYKGYINNKAKWIIISGLFFGCALGTKFNILFMPLIILLWILIKENRNILKKVFYLSIQMKIAFIVYPFIGFGIFYFSWPHMWFDSINNILQVFGYYRDFGIAPVQSMPDSYYLYGFNTYVVQWIVYTTPFITLFLASTGIIYALTKGFSEKNKTSLLIVLWLVVPIARVVMPGTSIYGGVRQIMEYIPPLAILSGIGAYIIVAKLQNIKVAKLSQLQKSIALQVIILFAFIPIVFKIVSMHPNESIYFNSFIGGLKGAKEKDIPGWGNSLGNPYRQAKYWINEHAEKGASVALVHELVSNIPRTLLREDIKYGNTKRSGPKREGEYIIGLTHYGTYEEFYHRKYLERFIDPVHEVKVDGVTILKIWKNDFEHTKPQFRRSEKEVEGITIKKPENTGKVIVEFPRKIRLTKLVIEYGGENCIIPAEGKIHISKDGESWTTLPGSFLEFIGFAWFQPNMEKGKLQYLFAAEDVRFVLFTRNAQDSCLRKNPVRVIAWEI